jgi:ribosome-associated protein
VEQKKPSAKRSVIKPKKKKPAAKTSLATALPSKPDPLAARREASKKTALAVAVAALDKKAERIEIVDLTGRSDRQVVAIAEGIEEALKQKGVKTVGREGLPQGHWVLLDYSDVIVHVFLDEARKYYDLEGLWMDAPRVPTPVFSPTPKTSAAEG